MEELYAEESVLLDRVTQGDRTAFNRLYSAHIDHVYNYIYLFTKSRTETEEALQEVFVHIWEHRERLAAVASFKYYVLRAAKNRVINHIRHNRIKARVFSEIRKEAGTTPAPPDHTIIYKECQRLIEEAIEKLPPKRKHIFMQHTEEGISYAGIAEELDISVSVVKKQFYKARQFVRQYLYIKGGLLPVLLLLPLRLIACLAVF